MFCPAHLSPAKQHYPPHAIAKHRLNMLELALEKMAHASVYAKELFRPPPSYTVDTVRALLEEEKGVELYLILGEDAAESLHQWKGVETLLSLASPLIGTRFGQVKKERPSPSAAIYQKISKGVCVIAAMDIEATEVRERLKNRLYCDHLVPAKVLDYIYQNRLYL